MRPVCRIPHINDDARSKSHQISLSRLLSEKVCNLLNLYWTIFAIRGLYRGRRQRLTPAMLHTVNTFCVMYVAN